MNVVLFCFSWLKEKKKEEGELIQKGKKLINDLQEKTGWNLRKIRSKAT
jgi:hypothetical protein